MIYLDFWKVQPNITTLGPVTTVFFVPPWGIDLSTDPIPWENCFFAASGGAGGGSGANPKPVYANKSAEAAAKSIPDRLKTSHDVVDLGQFSHSQRGLPGKAVKSRVNERTGWYIQKDVDGHGGSAWKLFDADGRRIASLDHAGRVLRD